MNDKPAVGKGRSTVATIVNAKHPPIDVAREQEQICMHARDAFRSAADRYGEAAACVGWALSVQGQHACAVFEAEEVGPGAR